MSGTSLDGLDIAVVNWTFSDQLHFNVESAETVPYTSKWSELLRFNPDISANKLLEINHDFGYYLGDLVNQFLSKYQIQASELDYIASHGHTYFHQPQAGYGYQLGGGPELSLRTGVPTVTDFRTADLARGGQGAPLAPILDRDLFPEYQACLNLGGIANVTLQHQKTIQAFDIAPANQVLNHLARRKGQEYDKDGRIARQGKVCPELLEQLDKLNFYHQPIPKSLGIEWTIREVFPLVAESKGSPEDLSRTYVEHLARQIARQLPDDPQARVLITGGGTFHKFLLERLQELYIGEIYLPQSSIINFKEAILVSYLGLLRWNQKVNVLASVTGADHDHCSGTVFQP